MNNRFGLLFALGLIVSTSVAAQVTITDTHEGGKPVPKPAPFNMKSATQAHNAQQAPLSNRAIIQMVKSGNQETAILAAIRSRGGRFDFSPQGCSALRGANVSQTILNAMGGSGGSQCTSALPSPGSVQGQPTGGMLLGNRNATLLGGSGGHGAATATPSNGGDPVALNPQPLPPRTGRTLLGNSAPASATSPAVGASKTATKTKLQPAGATSLAPSQPKSATGTSGTTGTSSAQPR
jgi:hypothetical protein